MEMLLPPPMNSSPDPASVVAIFELELHASVRQRRWIGQGNHQEESQFAEQRGQMQWLSLH
uniref:Uncharacterized protein n=1 Tax=Oryza rufipogon TaxID=4529 RepID=A0A0E0RF95_ORYRU